MHQELWRWGFEVCENTVAEVLKPEGILASTEKKFLVTATDSNHSLPVAENIPDRDFTAENLGEKLVSDLTCVATDKFFVSGMCD